MQRIPRRQFTDDIKSQANALAESIGPAKAARQLDMSVKTLANWLTDARAGKSLSAPPLLRAKKLKFLVRFDRLGMALPLQLQ